MPVAINTTIPKIAGLPDLWAKTVGEPQICVAVLDGWVDRSHPSLAEANLTQLEPSATTIGLELITVIGLELTHLPLTNSDSMNYQFFLGYRLTASTLFLQSILLKTSRFFTKLLLVLVFAVFCFLYQPIAAAASS